MKVLRLTQIDVCELDTAYSCAVPTKPVCFITESVRSWLLRSEDLLDLQNLQIILSEDEPKEADKNLIMYHINLNELIVWATSFSS